MNLERFKLAKAEELERLRVLEGKIAGREPCAPRPFLTPRGEGESIRIIAEYKRASPSRGVINERLTPEEIAVCYTAGGASAISVLTEETYFHGKLDFLHRVASRSDLPLLRKDFIFDAAQVRETAATPASALLLMVALTPDAGLLRELRELAESFGMTAVVEVFNERELEIARDTGAKVIQVNNRNLETLNVDVTASTRLITLKREGEIWISASGYETRAQLDALVGYDAALVGTSLMEATDPRAALEALT